MKKRAASRDAAKFKKFYEFPKVPRKLILIRNFRRAQMKMCQSRIVRLALLIKNAQKYFMARISHQFIFRTLKLSTSVAWEFSLSLSSLLPLFFSISSSHCPYFPNSRSSLSLRPSLTLLIQCLRPGFVTYGAFQKFPRLLLFPFIRDLKISLVFTFQLESSAQHTDVIFLPNSLVCIQKLFKSLT